MDRRSVVNPHQARALLQAVRTQQPSGPRLVAFFAVMYYAGLRPEEAVNLGRDNVILPPRVWGEESQQWRGLADDGDWGELHIRSATPDAGGEWTDDGSPREKRQLKHRAEGDSRIVPTHPELARPPYDLRHACLSTWLKRRCLSHSGGGVGRARRGRAAADLRQVRRRPG